MIKILQIGMDSSLGGIEMFVINIFRNIDKNKFKFDFIKNTDNEICFENEIKSMGGNVFSVTPRRKNFIRNIIDIKNIIKNGKYDIIHWQANSLSNNVAAMIGLYYNIPVIVHTHSMWKSNNLISFILHKFNYLLLPKKKIIKLACSDEAGKYLFKKDYIVLNNGINLDRFKFSKTNRLALRKQFSICEDDIVFGHIGRLSYPKNHKFIIEIFNEYQKINNKSKLILVGSGELENDLKELVNKNKLNDKVYFLGNRFDTEKFLSMFDIFLFPSIFEGLGISLIEAQVSGVQCVISDSIPKSAIISDKTVTLSLIDSAEKWANIISKIHIDDRNINFNDLRVKEYDICETAKKLEEIYTNIFEERKIKNGKKGKKN